MFIFISGCCCRRCGRRCAGTWRSARRWSAASCWSSRSPRAAPSPGPRSAGQRAAAPPHRSCPRAPGRYGYGVPAHRVYLGFGRPRTSCFSRRYLDMRSIGMLPTFSNAVCISTTRAEGQLVNLIPQQFDLCIYKYLICVYVATSRYIHTS